MSRSFTPLVLRFPLHRRQHVARALALLPIALGSLVALASAGVYDEQYAGYKTITYTPTVLSGDLAAQSDFPLLVRFKSTRSATGKDILEGSLNGGIDIRFASGDGATALAFERERWSDSAADFWVRVPTMNGTSGGIGMPTTIRVYYGNIAAEEASNPAAVFDTALGYRAVWHMNGASSASDETDATQNGFTASLLGSGGAAPSYGGVGPSRNFTHASGDSSGFFVGRSSSLFDLHMFDANNGLAVGMGGLVMRTTDGGATWTPNTSTVVRSTTFQLNLIGLACPSLNVCYAVGGTGWPGLLSGGARVSYKSANGGSTWTRTSLAGEGTPHFLRVSCDSDTSCVATNGSLANGTHVSRNGGTSWASLSGLVTRHAIHCIPGGNTCYSVGGTTTNRVVYKLTNVGGTWSSAVQENTSAAPLQGIYCPTSDICYAVGDGGQIIKTVDAGGTGIWSTLTSGTTQNLRSVHCLDASTCVAVGNALPWVDGNSSIILKTTDGGATWSNKSVAGLNDSLFAVKITGLSTGVIVGANGTVLRTTNGGDTWTLNANSRKLAFATNGSYDFASGSAGSGKGDNYALSSWVGISTTTFGANAGQMAMVGKGDNHWVMQTYGDDQFGMAERNWMACAGTPATACAFPTGNTNAHSLATGAAPSAGWHHVVGVRVNNAQGGALTADAESLYVDGGTKCGGSVVAGANASGGAAGLFSTQRGFLDIVTLGRNANTWSRFWKRGPLDEIRIDGRHRSADWVCLSYQTQTPDTAAYYARFNMGNAVSLRPADRDGSHAFNLTGGGEYLFAIPEAAQEHFEGAKLRVVDVSGRIVWSSFVRPGDATRAIRWDGRDVAGHRLNAGVYFARLKVLSAGKSREFALKANLTR